jgi:hypothetical protein
VPSESMFVDWIDPKPLFTARGSCTYLS